MVNFHKLILVGCILLFIYILLSKNNTEKFLKNHWPCDYKVGRVTKRACHRPGSPGVSGGQYSLTDCKQMAESCDMCTGKSCVSSGPYRTKGCYTYTRGGYRGKVYFGTGGNRAQRARGTSKGERNEGKTRQICTTKPGCLGWKRRLSNSASFGSGWGKYEKDRGLYGRYSTWAQSPNCECKNGKGSGGKCAPPDF